MSMIEEALRRAQGPLTPAPAPAPAAPATAGSAVQTPPAAPAHSWSPAAAPEPAAPLETRSPATIPTLIVTSLVVGVSALVIGAAVIGRAQTADRPAVTAAAPASPAGQATQAVAAPPQDGLALSGIVLGGKDSYAVINGTIVLVGDRLDGYLVTEITEASVTLKDARGRTTLLQLSR